MGCKLRKSHTGVILFAFQGLYDGGRDLSLWTADQWKQVEPAIPLVAMNSHKPGKSSCCLHSLLFSCCITSIKLKCSSHTVIFQGKTNLKLKKKKLQENWLFVRTKDTITSTTSACCFAPFLSLVTLLLKRNCFLVLVVMTRAHFLSLHLD